jgi:hypothetical protein
MLRFLCDWGLHHWEYRDQRTWRRCSRCRCTEDHIDGMWIAR